MERDSPRKHNNDLEPRQRDDPTTDQSTGPEAFQDSRTHNLVNPGQIHMQGGGQPNHLPPPPAPGEHSEPKIHKNNGSVPPLTSEEASKQTQTSRTSAGGTLFLTTKTNTLKNIIIFGETGTGKSSLVNMLSDNEVATVSNGASGCTFENVSYPITIGDKPYVLWDTAGLNEGETGSVPGDEALRHLRDLVENLKDGLSLLVYCIRGTRYRDIIKVNYDLFTKTICQEKIPAVIVVTGLENEDPMDEWWKENEREFARRGMRFEGCACVTTSKGRKNMFEEEYERSKNIVRDLIKLHCPDKAWVVNPELWFNRITEDMIQRYYEDYNSRVPMGRDDRDGWQAIHLLKIIYIFMKSAKDLIAERLLQARKRLRPTG